MRPQLETVYKTLYDDYTYQNDYPFRNFADLSLIRSIKKTIQDAERDHLNKSILNDVKLRPDAKYFLVILFIQMVSLPLRLEDAPSNVPGISTLDNDIIKDINYLLEEGYKIKASADVKEITAHTILTLMDENWNRLSISKFELWNKK